MIADTAFLEEFQSYLARKSGFSKQDASAQAAHFVHFLNAVRSRQICADLTDKLVLTERRTLREIDTLVLVSFLLDEEAFRQYSIEQHVPLDIAIRTESILMDFVPVKFLADFMQYLTTKKGYTNPEALESAGYLQDYFGYLQDILEKKGLDGHDVPDDIQGIKDAKVTSADDSESLKKSPSGHVERNSRRKKRSADSDAQKQR